MLGYQGRTQDTEGLGSVATTILNCVVGGDTRRKATHPHSFDIASEKKHPNARSLSSFDVGKKYGFKMDMNSRNVVW